MLKLLNLGKLRFAIPFSMDLSIDCRGTVNPKTLYYYPITLTLTLNLAHALISYAYLEQPLFIGRIRIHLKKLTIKFFVWNKLFDEDE